MEEEGNIAWDKEDGYSYIVDSCVRDLGIEFSNIRKKVVMCYPGVDIDFIKDRLEVAHRSRGVIIYVGGK